MAVITISHEMGSGGSTLGVALAERLGYRYIGPATLSEVARRYGVVENRLIHFAEAKPSLVERFDAETRRYLAVLESALLDVAEHDNAVIVGRSGQVLLRGIRHVLRVLVIAPIDLRVRRILETMRAGAFDVRTVAEMVRRSDQEKAGRVRYLFGVDRRDPALYDLVLNTERLAIAGGVDLVVRLLQRPDFAVTDASRQAVHDRALAARVRAALAADLETRKHRLAVAAERGVVRLEGPEGLDRAAGLARALPGVVDVQTHVLVPPPLPPFGA